MKHAGAAVLKGNVLAIRVGLVGLACLTLGACGGRTLSPEGEGAPDVLDTIRPTHPATSAAAASKSPSVENTGGATVPADSVAPATVGAQEPSVLGPPDSSVPSDPGSDEPGSAPSGGSSSSAACEYPNYPSTHWSPTEWVPYAPTGPGGGADVASLLSGVRVAMVGRWHGQVTTPWTTPYEVDVTFDADGHYSARCSEPAIACCCSAFYYGTDDDTPIKQWRVNDATLGGNVFGQIDIAFDYRNERGVDYGLPAWQGELSNIERNAAGDGLRFQFATSSGYGPLHYDLRRVE